MENLLKFIKVIVLLSIGIFAWGFVVYKFYTWFLLEVFNLPEITLVQAIGVKMFISLFDLGSYNFVFLKEDLFEDSKNERITTGIILPWLVLLIAYIFKVIFL